MEVAPENPRAVANPQGRAEKAFPEAFVDHQPGDQRSQQRQAEKRHQVPAPAVAIGERHQPPAMQGAGERLEIELRRGALNGAGIRVDVDRQLTSVGVVDPDVQGKVRLVGTTDAVNDDIGLGLFDRTDDLVVVEPRRIVRRLAGAHLRVGQPDDFLAHHGQGAGHADDQDEKPDRQCQPAMDQEPEF
ncbi:hypothetical protein D3C87_1418870 [compost metagenome]